MATSSLIAETPKFFCLLDGEQLGLFLIEIFNYYMSDFNEEESSGRRRLATSTRC
jgi:hypothetical protein